MTSKPEWKLYQEETAAFFRGIGLDAEIEEDLQGSRAKHKVDVVVRGELAGFRQLWVVECKRLNRAVSKDKVLTLAQVVQDVGADRGIMVCEKGYQAGAIRAATTSNISLTSLADLSEYASEEKAQLLARTTLHRLVLLEEELNGHTVVERSPGVTRITFPQGFLPQRFSQYAGGWGWPSQDSCAPPRAFFQSLLTSTQRPTGREARRPWPRPPRLRERWLSTSISGLLPGVTLIRRRHPAGGLPACAGR